MFQNFVDTGASASLGLPFYKASYIGEGELKSGQISAPLVAAWGIALMGIRDDLSPIDTHFPVKFRRPIATNVVFGLFYLVEEKFDGNNSDPIIAKNR